MSFRCAKTHLRQSTISKIPRLKGREGEGPSLTEIPAGAHVYNSRHQTFNQYSPIWDTYLSNYWLIDWMIDLFIYSFIYLHIYLFLYLPIHLKLQVTCSKLSRAWKVRYRRLHVSMVITGYEPLMWHWRMQTSSFLFLYLFPSLIQSVSMHLL